MAAISARQAIRGLLLPSAGPSLKQSSPRPFPTAQLDILSRNFSIRAVSRQIPTSRTSIVDLCRSNRITISSSQRSFSLWPASPSETFPKDESSLLNQEPSPDAMASGVSQASSHEQGSLVNSTSVSASSIEPSSADVASHMADAAEKVQTLADLGQLSSWPNVRAAQYVLDWMTEATQLPWWATIALVTIMVRVMVLPLVFKGQANAIRLANISPKMQSHMKDLNYAKTTGNNRLMIESMQATQKLLKDNDCHPLKSLITPAVLMPLFISFFFALKGLAKAGISSMETGGLFWFPNLLLPDPLVILPVLSAGMSLAILETGAEMGGTDPNQAGSSKNIKNVLRAITVISVPFLWKFPAAVFCFWVTNNTFSLIQLYVLKQPSVRKALKLPKKIDHNAADGPRGKPMGFWESVGAGKSSQTIDVRRLDDSVPSVLQTRRQLEDGREAALQKLMMQQEEPQQGAAVAEPLVSSSAGNAPVAASSPIGSRLAEDVIVEAEETPVEAIDEKEVASIRREEEKRRRVQEAREKRMKKKRHT